MIQYPVMIRRQLKSNPDIQTGDALERFKDSKKGQSCFVVGNGPSLTIDDLKRINPYDSFAANGIWGVFQECDWRPTYYFLGDPRYARYIDNNIRIPIESAEASFFIYTHLKQYHPCVFEYPNVYFYFQPYRTIYHRIYDKITFKRYPKYSRDITKMIPTAGTITYEMLQVALYMGYSNIYLLGIDHTYQKGEHFRSCHGTKGKPPENLIRWERAYETIKRQAKKRGINVYNATRGGMLEVFERVNLEEII